MKAHTIWQSRVNTHDVRIYRTSEANCSVQTYHKKSNTWIEADLGFANLVFSVAFLATNIKLRQLADQATDFLNGVE